MRRAFRNIANGISSAFTIGLLTAGFAFASPNTGYVLRDGVVDSVRNTDQILVAGWTQTGSYTNAPISAELGDVIGDTISAHLTNQLGPGMTAANEIVSTSISPATSEETDTLFTGLSLGTGSYYQVLAAPGETNEASWCGTNSTAATGSRYRIPRLHLAQLLTE